MDTKKKPGGGCLFWGGIIAAVLVVLALLAAFASYRFVRHVVDEYTDTKPIEIPAVQMSNVEVSNLQQRVEGFDKALESNKPTEPLSLSADDVNALIAQQTKTNPARVELYFTFDRDRVQAKLSMPTDGLGVKMLKGRYFNGSGEFTLGLHDGKLSLKVKSLQVKGKPLPENFMASLRNENFADAWTNDAKFNNALSKLEEIKIENGRLTVLPKPPSTTPAPKDDKLEKPANN